MPIDPKTGRPKVGPADPETVRRIMRETREEEKQEARKFVDKKAEEEAAKPKPKKKRSTLRDLLDPHVKRERTVEGEHKSLMEAVEEGVRQGSDKKRK